MESQNPHRTEVKMESFGGWMMSPFPEKSKENKIEEDLSDEDDM